MENNGLNEQQIEAVNSIDGPLLILAGAGTGKTKTLISRIVNIISGGHANINEILAVTFTNKAAQEMNSRVFESTNGLKLEWMGTFHSMAAKILRKHSEIVGLTKDFVIIDVEDQIRLLKSVTGNELDKEQLRKIANTIQRWKDKGYTCDKVVIKNSYDSLILQYYKSYQERLVASNSIDFGDILLYNIVIFNLDNDVLHEYQSRFKYIMVDEYQDTNVLQYLWLRILSQNNKNICCVGDDDQSIYGWRGAEIDNILRFSDDYPGSKVIRLERNYRSTSNILEVASSLISNNSGRLGKKLWTESNEGAPVGLLSFYDGRYEARYIVNYISRICKMDFSLNEVAILVRSGAQTRVFEESFVNLGIPYKIVGNLRFYERREVKDLMAYLRLVLNENDDIAFERVINVPKREVGAVTIKKIYYEAVSRSVSMMEAMKSMLDEGMIKRGAGPMSIFVQDIDRWSKLIKEVSLSEFMELLAEESGYMSMLKNDKEGKIDNVKELISAVSYFQDPVQFLQHVSLVSSSDYIDNKPMVNVMTLHMAKGLEFPCVFLPGWEEGVFPNQRSINEDNSVEEERRLAYVGITRARKVLFISYAKNRFLHNSWQSFSPSRFISELPAANIQHMDFTGDGRLNRNSNNAY